MEGNKFLIVPTLLPMVVGARQYTEVITNRLQEVCNAFKRLKKVWEARIIERRTKIPLFQTLVRPVPLYGYETWKITKVDEQKLNI